MRLLFEMPLGEQLVKVDTFHPILPKLITEVRCRANRRPGHNDAPKSPNDFYPLRVLDGFRISPHFTSQCLEVLKFFSRYTQD